MGFVRGSAVIFLYVVFATTGPAQSLGNNEVEGLCIFKTRASQPDSVATIFEYRSTVEYPTTAYIFPVSGSKIRIPPAADCHFIPYPGRSDLDRRTALTLIDLVKTRFPQFGKILHRVEGAWKTFDGGNPATAAASGNRHFRAAESIRKMSEGRTSGLPAPVSGPSVLAPATAMKPPPATPAQVGTNSSASGDVENLQKNLDALRQILQSTGAE
jgi:hypothetical protein